MKIKWLVIGGLTLALGLAGYYFYKQYQILKEFPYRPVGYRIKKVALKSVIVEVDIEVGNESELDITITGYNINTSVNGVNIGVLASKLSQFIPAKGSGIVTLSVQFDPTNVLKTTFSLSNLNQIFNQKDQMVFAFTGFMSSTISGVTVKNLPIDIKTSLADIVPVAA